MTAKDNQFGQFVRDRREELKISLRQMAREMQVDPSYISKIEQGHLPPPVESKIKLLAKKLKVDADELLSLANKIPSDLKPILSRQPKPIADFLRSSQGLSEADWDILRQKARQLQEKSHARTRSR